MVALFLLMPLLALCRIRLIGLGRRRNGVFLMDYLHVPAHSATALTSVSSSTSSFETWHRRLGHLCGSRLNSLVQSGVLGHVPNLSLSPCEACVLGKHVKLRFRSSNSRSMSPFDLVHSEGTRTFDL